MATTYPPLTVPRHNPTERDGLREREPVQPLEVSVLDRVKARQAARPGVLLGLLIEMAEGLVG